ncbi:MAG TPA: type I methionyl aminopeptidase [Candidatus Woesebacteria bacterium]|jgi:methionyl aminopeptidase|nr:type I methionyl aminopeptidase [Candidatus Woesebacteria bacterium]HNS94672.1 type I methionyl aminopeptidase [Candidatus Woesebacteria bacterium]
MKFEKTTEEIRIMTECGKRLREARMALIETIKAGDTTAQVDARADNLLKVHGLDASFKTVQGYHWATCIAVNHQAVHTPPNETVLCDGDVVTVDFGGLYQGYHTDWATTIIVGNISDTRKERFLNVGKQALERTISALGVGVRLGIVGQIMQQTIEGAGYKVLKDLTGHGIGKNLHEDPYIPNVVTAPIEKTYQIRPGFVAAIEVIYSESTAQIVQKSADKWSIDTADGSLAACFEHTVLIDQNGVHILT